MSVAPPRSSLTNLLRNAVLRRSCDGLSVPVSRALRPRRCHRQAFTDPRQEESRPPDPRYPSGDRDPSRSERAASGDESGAAPDEPALVAALEAAREAMAKAADPTSADRSGRRPSTTPSSQTSTGRPAWRRPSTSSAPTATAASSRGGSPSRTGGHASSCSGARRGTGPTAAGCSACRTARPGCTPPSSVSSSSGAPHDGLVARPRYGGVARRGALARPLAASVRA